MARALGPTAGGVDYIVEVVDLAVARIPTGPALVGPGRALRQIFCQYMSAGAVVSCILGQGRRAHQVIIGGYGWNIPFDGELAYEEGIWLVHDAQAGLTVQLVLIHDSPVSARVVTL